ncbi:MAG TPA: PAS domain S-box protein [Gemmatimonadaceae bacterium]|nr:PAS domain S-box protein [Gemmatimonadaceae bacterium]
MPDLTVTSTRAESTEPPRHDPAAARGKTVNVGDRHGAAPVPTSILHIVATLSSLGDAVVVTSRDGIVRLWTPAAELMLGWHADDALERSLIALLDPSPAAVDAPRSDVFLDATHWHGPATVNHRLRGRTTVHLSLAQVDDAAATGDDTHAGTYIILRVRPFTERSRPARADDLDPEVLERALEHVGDVVMITAGTPTTDSSVRIVYVNESFERTTGFSRDEVIGRSPQILRGPDTDVAASDRIDTAIRDRERVREEVLNYTKQGEPLWFDLDVMPVDGPSGAFMQWVAVERDITAQKGQEVALRAREERLRLALNAVWDGLWDWHVPTGYCYYAPRWYSMLGFDEHALPPHIDTFLDLLHPMDVQVCEQALREHFDGRADTYALEVRLRTASNTWRWVLTRGTVVERDSHGRPVRMVGTHTDIAERKKIELALRTSEDRFRTLTMASPLGIFLTDSAGECTFVTPRMLDLWGAPVESLLGRGFLDAAHPDDRVRVHRAWQTAVREGGELSMEYRVLRPDGEVRWICERTAAHRDGTILTGFVGTVEDITAQKVAGEHRRRLELQMQHAQKLESLGVLAGGIAHDFNNLLVGILGNVSVAREDAEPGTPNAELLEDVEIAARRAAELTTQLLAYAGKGRFNVQPLDLSSAVRETSSLLQSAISKRASLEMQLADELPVIAADGTQVRQVIMNLLTNASDALNEQVGEIVLRTGAMHADAAYLRDCLAADGVQPGEFVFVEVGDTGVGMSGETLARIFDPFFTTKFTGRGLGLAATLGIVRGHRGALHVESMLGMGTTFRVLFPVAESRPVVRHTPRSMEAIRRDGTILVVDDEESVRNVARRMLERSGYSVIAAHDGDEGLRMYEEHADVIVAIVLDVTMPRMSGTEVLAELRRRGTLVPVVLASGYTSQSISTPGAGAASPTFVQKPFVTSALLAGIDEALASHLSHRQ